MTEANSLPRQTDFVLRGHEGAVLNIRFNRDGNYALSCGQDKTVRLWNPHKGLSIKAYTGHAHEVYDCDVTEDNSKIVTGSGDKGAFLWDVSTGKIIRRLRGHTHRVNAVRLNNNSSLLASASYDQTVRLWDLRSNSFEPIQVLDHFRDSVTSVQFTDSEIIAGSVDGFIRTYDIRSGRLINDNVNQPVTNITISADQNCLLVSTLDNTVRLLDKATGEVLAEYLGHLNSQYKVGSVLTQHDANVASGSEDGRIMFWSLVEGEIVHILRGHEQAVVGLAQHPTGTTLLSSSIDGTIRVWS